MTSAGTRSIDAKHSSATLNPLLPGASPQNNLFGYTNYPGFGPLKPNLWFSFWTGKAGLGDGHFCNYGPETGTYKVVGTNLKGIQSNPYTHRIDYRNSQLYVNWVFRGFVWYGGWDDPDDEKHKQLAGPNSAENNYDICFAYSVDKRTAWRDGVGVLIADLSRGENVTLGSHGPVAFEIPKGSGLSNQEPQAVDLSSGIHVLNRDNVGGEQKWKRSLYHYRPPNDLEFGALEPENWTQHALPHVKGFYGDKRGRLAVSRDNDLYSILLDPEAPILTILKASKLNIHAEYELVCRGD